MSLQRGFHLQVLHRLNVQIVSVPEYQSESVMAALRQDPDVEFVERDYLARAAFLPNDPYISTGAEWHLARVQAAQAWDLTVGVTNAVVAVLDSGTDPTHPDLAAEMLPGYDFINNNNEPVDDFGHGTAVSGVVVAAGNNGLGVAGLAYGARVLPVKVMDSSGFAAYSCIAQGINYAVDQGARVINLSIAGSSPSATLQEAIDYAWSNNVVIVAAAGNNANDTPQYPAACDHVVAVSATEPDDSLAWFSSYGADVALSAPGDTIWTTRNDPNNPYGPWSGTSFSSPIVAAAAALVISENPSLSNTQIVSILEQNADDLGTAGYDLSFGYGRINAFRSVTAASLQPGALQPATLPAPSVMLSSPADSTQFPAGTTVPVTVRTAPGAGNTTVTNVVLQANGARLAALASPPFAYDWIPAGPGSYTLVAIATDDRGLSATSAPVSINVLPQDPGAASVTITLAPPNRSRLHSPLVTLAGTAAAAAGINRVLVQLNGTEIQPADGSTNWTAQILLAPGRNIVLVRTVDLLGNVSPAVTREFTYVVKTPLTVRINGAGKVKPNLNGRLLEIGKLYTLRAVPSRGQAFAGWTETGNPSPVSSFVMQSNLTLTANFVPSPFPPVQGAYAGLMTDTNNVLPENSGAFRLNVTASGRFTGRLFVGGKGYGFHGKLSLAGDTVTTVRRGRLNPIALNLHVDLSGATDTVVGSATDGAWASELSGDRNVFKPKKNPAQQAGSRRFVLEQAVGPARAAATGTCHISRGGKARIRGRLDNGRIFTTATLLAQHGDCPFYLSLEHGSEIVIGWLNFPTPPSPAANGTVLWVGTGTNAFAATLKATGQ